MKHLGDITKINGAEQYGINSNGIVVNLKSNRKMATYSDKDGYQYVLLISDTTGKRKKYSLHRLVAKAFIPNPYNKPQVNHINGIKSDNTLNNLEWVTNSENQYHSRYNLGNHTGFADRAVVCVDTMTCFESTRAAWRNTGISYCHISECASGKRKTAGGVCWRYAEEVYETLR